MKDIIIYTDGACSGNPGPGGWAAIIHFDEGQKILYGWSSYTTNNRMELLAPIRALEQLDPQDTNQEIHIYTDSQYLKNGITTWINKWKKNNWKTAENKRVKNIDLWMMLDELSQKFNIKWEWVKAHFLNTENNWADYVAKNSITLGQRGELEEDKLGLLR